LGIKFNPYLTKRCRQPRSSLRTILGRYRSVYCTWSDARS